MHRLGIKWPNDVYIGNRKIAGILIESPGGPPPAKNGLIIGIGINVNNSWRDATHDAAPHATALCDVTGQPHDLQVVLTNVLNAIAARVAQLRARHPELIQAWHKLDLLAGHDVIVEADGRRSEGKCVEIADDGALIVQTAFQVQRYYCGSVRLT